MSFNVFSGPMRMALCAALLWSGVAQAQERTTLVEPAAALTLQQALQLALDANPTLAAARRDLRRMSHRQ